MNARDSLPQRALGLASAVGDGLKQALPVTDQWLQTGAKLGALKGGMRMATMLVRRHPVATAAALAGAGLLWYAARRKARDAESGVPIEGHAQRIEARKPVTRKSRTAARARR